MRLVLQLLAAALFLSVISRSWAVQADNITQVLSSHGEYSVFTSFLVKTKVAYEINSRSSITVLAPSDNILLPVVQQHGVAVLADILRYHILLQFFDSAELHSAANSTVTTLFQTTGRAVGDAGIVDVSLQADGTIAIGHRGEVEKTARIQQQVYSNPYNLSVFDISAVLVPNGLPQTDPPSVNITDVLVRAGNFNTFIALLTATNLVPELQSKADSGLTLLVPNDAVFSRTFTPDQIDRLSFEQKATLLKAHALPSYDPIEFLSLIPANTILTTLASSASQTDYLLSVSPNDGKVFVGTGIVTAGLENRPVYQNYPVAIFSVDSVLVPKEIFNSFPPASAPDTATASPQASDSSPPALPPSTGTTTPPPALPDTSPVSSPPTPTSSPPVLPTPTPSPSSGAPVVPVPSPKRSPTPAPRAVSAAGPGPHSGPSRGGGSGAPSEAQQGENGAPAAGRFSLAALVVSSFASWLFL